MATPNLSLSTFLLMLLVGSIIWFNLSKDIYSKYSSATVMGISVILILLFAYVFFNLRNLSL